MPSKILSVVWYKVLPAVYGGQKDIALFNHYLGIQTELVCVCSDNNKQTDNLTYKLLPLLPVSKTQFFNPLVKRKIRKLIEETQFTHIILEHPYHAWLCRYKDKYGFKLVVHAHNIEFLRMQQRNKWWWPWVKRTEAIAFKNADHILFKTEKDKKEATRIFGADEKKCLLVPYGTTIAQPPADASVAREKIRQLHGIKPGTIVFLFAGSFDYEPNLEALDNIVNKVLPYLEHKLSQSFFIMICGAVDEEKKKSVNQHPSLLFTGFINHMEEDFAAADVFLNPVITGSGMQTKNIDALANNLPVVCTEYAATGLPDYLLNKQVLVSANDDWEKFVLNCIDMIHKKTGTPPLFYQDFYWENIIRRTLTKIV